MTAEFLPLLLLSPVLLAAAYCDLRYMRIPNELSLIALGIFALFAPFVVPVDALLLRTAIAFAVLVLGFAGFVFRVLGGGDVKFLAALMLFVPTQSMSLFMFTFSAAMIFGMALMPMLRAIPNAASTGWVALQPGAKFPMGISIGLAGLSYPVMVAVLRAV